MSMKRIQVQFDEQDYQTIRKICFLEKRAISDVVREATKIYLSTKEDIDDKMKKLFASDHEVEKSINDSIEDFSEVYKKLSQSHK